MEKLDARSEDLTFDIQHVNLFYGKNQALKDISMQVRKNEITALIGPSGCGKSTLLKTLNRMNDFVEGCRVEGSIKFEGLDNSDDLFHFFSRNFFRNFTLKVCIY